MLIFWLAKKLTKTPTIHTVTFGVAHIETGGLHVCRKNIPPFILVTQGGLSACRTLLTCCGESTMKNTFRNPHRAKKGKIAVRNAIQIRVLSTFHPIRVGPWWAWWAGGCVIVIETRVTGGAGLSVSTWRQRLSSSHTLQAYLRFNPLIHDLRLKRQRDGRWWWSRTETVIREWVFSGCFYPEEASFLSPCPRGHMLCGSGNSPSWNMEVCLYTQRIPQLRKWKVMMREN